MSSLHQTRPAFRAPCGNRPLRLIPALWLLVAAAVLLPLPASASITPDCVISVGPDGNVLAPPNANVPFSVSVADTPGGDVCTGAIYSLTVLNDTSVGMQIQTTGFAPVTSGSGGAGSTQNYLVNLPNANGPGTATIRAECTSGCVVGGSADEFTIATEVIDLGFTAPAPAGQVTGTINTDLPVPIRLTKDGAPIPGISLAFSLLTGSGGGFGMGMSAFDSAVTDSNGVAVVNFRAIQEGSFSAQVEVTDCDFFAPALSADAAKGCVPYDVATIAINVAINRTLTIVSGNNSAGQTGDVATLVVEALDDGAPVTTSIDWVIIEGSDRATLGNPTAGGAPGQYQIPVTFAANTGLVRVEARRFDLTNAPVVFTLENFAYQLERLNPADGINSGPTNSDIGYQVRLNRVGIATTGVAGNTINWSQSGPGTGSFLTQGGGPPSTSSVTDSAGVAAIDFRSATSGLYSIEASSAAPAAAGPVAFSTTVFAQNLSSDGQPAGPNYTDEATGGVSVIASNTVGANSSPIPDVPVTFTITGGQATFVGGATSAGPVATDSAGRATSPGLVIGRGVTPIAIQANAPGRPTVNFSVPVTASSYSLSSSNLSFNVLTQDVVNLPVTLQRQGSSTPAPLSGASISWQISPATGASVGSPTTTTGSTGDASNSFVAASAGSYTVTATFDPGFSPPGPSTVTFTVNVAPQSRDILIISGDGQSAAAGGSYASPLVVQTRENGNPVGNVPLVVSVNNPGDISVSPSAGSSDTSGSFQVSASLSAVAASDRPPTVTITRSDDPTVSATFTLQVDPPPAPSRRELVKGDVSGDGQRGEPGQMLALPLRVVALDDGRPVEGAQVRWVTSEGVSLMSADGGQRGAEVSGLTGPFGIATVNVTLPETSDNSRGEFMITASRPGTSASTAFVVRYASSTDDGLSLRIVAGDNQVGLPGQSLADDFVVAVTRGDQPVSGVVVSFAAAPADGRLSATRVSTDTQGRAATRLTFGAANAYQVTASLDERRSVTFNAAGPNNRLLIKNGNRQGGVLGSQLDRPLEVELLTVDGTPIPRTLIQWQVEDNGDATLGGSGTRLATSLTNELGIAAISVELGTTTASSNLRVSAGTTSVPQPVFFTVASRPPGLGPTSGNNQTGPVNTALPNPLELQITEGVAGKSLAGVPVRWTIDLGGGSLGSATTSTNAQGKTSNTWTLGGLVGTQRVVATLPGGATVEFSATATANVAQSRLVRVSGDGQTLITGTASAPLVVEVRDSANAAQLDVPIIWSVENVDGTPSTLAGFQNGVTRTVTAAGGQARNVVVFTSPGSVVVRARFDGQPATTESVTFRLQAGISPIPSLSPVARDVGEAFDNFCDDVLAATNPNAGTADLADVCTVLNDNADEDPAGVGEALDQLQNDVAPTLGTTGIDAVTTQFDNLDVRLHMIRGEQFGGRQNQFNIGLWTPDGVLPLSFLPSMVVAAGEDESTTEEVGADFGRWGFFATGQIGRGEADAGSRSPQFDFDIAGLTVGADYRFSDRLVGGVALGYSDNDAELGDGRGDLDSKGWNIAGYATWYSEQAWFVDATAVYGQIDYDLRRRILFSLANRDGSLTTVDQVASASTDGDALGASFSVGRDWQKGPWNLTGYLKGNYSKVDTDAYTESLIAGRPGEGLGLIIEDRSTTSMTSIFGGRATYILSRDWGILMPTATLEWEHEFQDDPNRIIARFAFDPTATRIVRDGDDIDSNYFNVGVGVSALFPGGRSAYLYYEELVGASRLSQGLLSLGLRLEF